jgi:Holliday junction DNA helicase RuvA
VIAGLRGEIIRKEPDAVLIDVGGVVYRVGTSSTTLSELSGDAELVYLHTRLIVREDQLALFGFLTQEEVVLFDLVTGVTGIGPRIACSILSRFTPEALHAALVGEDVTLLSTVPGIGKKTAARMIVELRGKLPALEGGIAGSLAMAPADIEAVEALKALGYTPAEAHAALAGSPRDETATVEERVVAALQLLGAS